MVIREVVALFNAYKSYLYHFLTLLVKNLVFSQESLCCWNLLTKPAKKRLDPESLKADYTVRLSVGSRRRGLIV